jgi:outer membrane lipoprotein SlyB
VIAALALGACASTTPYPPNPNVASSGNGYSAYGVVNSIELVQQGNNNGGSSVGLGTIAGAVVGGLVGSQVGAGRGSTVATVVGAAGGAYVGHELENRQQQNTDAYRITARMDDGSYQSLMKNSNAGFRVGDRVLFENGDLRRY